LISADAHVDYVCSIVCGIHNSICDIWKVTRTIPIPVGKSYVEACSNGNDGACPTYSCNVISVVRLRSSNACHLRAVPPEVIRIGIPRCVVLPAYQRESVRLPLVNIDIDKIVSGGQLAIQIRMVDVNPGIEDSYLDVAASRRDVPRGGRVDLWQPVLLTVLRVIGCFVKVV